MDNNNINIENLIRDKFESFAPNPPEHIWNGIEDAIDSKPAAVFSTSKKITTATIILLLASLGYLFNPFSNNTSGSTDPAASSNIMLTANNIQSAEKSVNNVTEIKKQTVEHLKQTEVVINNSSNASEDKSNSSENSSSKKMILFEKFADEIEISNTNIELGDNSPLLLNGLGNKSSFNVNSNQPRVEPIAVIRSNIEISDDIDIEPVKKKRTSKWQIRYYLSPELSISNIDSVEILNSYSFSIEPTYFFNKNWFVRSGLGLSYVSDRGFAKIEYVVNEYVGSYDDVYNVTFDTVSGDVIPIYHTKTVEVWDTINHISVSNITNKYLYLQVPALFGYSSKKEGSPFSWYVIGGPAFYFKTSSWIEEPKPDEDDASIIELKNNLPIRNSNYVQLWIGAGLEYELNKTFAIAVEPGYRHYISNIYKNTDNKGPTSGFTLRVGLVYKLK